MIDLEEADNVSFPYQRFRRSLRVGIALMLLFCITSFTQLMNEPSLLTMVNALSDTTFVAVGLFCAIILTKWRIEYVSLLLAGAILAYSLVNIILFPTELIRIVELPLFAVIQTLAYIDSRKLRWLSVIAWILILVMFVISNHWFASFDSYIDLAALAAACALIFVVLNQFHYRIHELLVQVQRTNAALASARADLEVQVAERTAELQQALSDVKVHADEQARLFAETQQQRIELQAMSLPILPVGPMTLAAPLVGSFDAERMHLCRQQALVAMERAHARALVLDITGMFALDQAVAQGIIELSQSLRLMGSRLVIAGIRPELAQLVVGLGLNLEGIESVATLQEGIARAIQAPQRQ